MEIILRNNRQRRQRKGGYFRIVMKILSFVTRSVHKERQKQNEIFSHTPHLLFTGGLLTAFEDLPLLLNGIIS